MRSGFIPRGRVAAGSGVVLRWPGGVVAISSILQRIPATVTSVRSGTGPGIPGRVVREYTGRTIAPSEESLVSDMFGLQIDPGPVTAPAPLRAGPSRAKLPRR
jgi:hypothetical protein